MNLGDIFNRKKAVSTENAHELLAKELESIFKWGCSASLLQSNISRVWLLLLVVPDGISEDDFDFTTRMIERKLPSLVEKYLGKGLTISELRPSINDTRRASLGVGSHFPSRLSVTIK